MNEGPIVCNAGPLIALASVAQLRAPLVLIDERRARRIASQVQGLTVRGTAGILVEAKRHGLLHLVRPFLEDMTRRGYFLSRRLIEMACQEAGE